MGGGGSTYDYGFRIYNPQIGKFLSVDPLFMSYPWFTPYQFAGNDPIRNIDIDGLEGGSMVESYLVGELEKSWNQTVSDIKGWWNSWSILPSKSPNAPAPPVKKSEATPEIKKVDEAQVAKKVLVSAPWMSTAIGETGQKEIKGKEHNPRIIEYHSTTGGFKDDETPWCASFCNWVMEEAGYEGTGSARALSWKDWGESTGGEPVYGAIAVIDYGAGKGHVGFVTGIEGDNITVMLGGNQSDQVKESKFKRSSIVDYRVPKGYEIPDQDKKMGEKKVAGSAETLETTR